MASQIEIPEPAAGDSETVITALETAAVFRDKGDVAEALRWLQRAAESASDGADDTRTLALARSVAELNRRLQPLKSVGPEASIPVAPEPATPSRRLPKPPARVSSVRPTPPSERSNPPQGVVEVREAVLPSKPAAVNQTAGKSSTVDLSGTPIPPASQSRPAASSGRSISNPALARTPNSTSSTRANGSSPSSARAPLSFASKEPRPSNGATVGSAGTNGRGAQAPAVHEPEPTEAEPQRPTQPVPAPVLREKPHADLRLRQALRVSVIRSEKDPTLFLVRTLADGASPPSDCSEALLVLTDPNADLLSR